MKTILYLAGVATPFAVWFVFSLISTIYHWRARRRYQRAWDKFSAEFDLLGENERAACNALWQPEPRRFRRRRMFPGA